MNLFERLLVVAAMIGLAALSSNAQVYSPKVLVKGQIDTSDLTALAKDIIKNSGAVTPRQMAEAIWRFFLTDGRFVPPGFWYHIAGWAYEEPQGEVLDPMKLFNSYGFGLCYQIAPALEAVYKAAGFDDARVWFLTGHTVTEVFYDGAYHHYDSDMLGYTTVGKGDPRTLPVASVSQIARDGSIMLSKLKSPKKVDSTKVDYPWYPADVNAGAIGDLASAFTTTNDNWLYAFTRYPQAHSMEFVLRPGERLTRYFKPEVKGSFYLPYKFDGTNWTEFPREISEYKIRTDDGPKSEKDGRRWATGRIEYSPVLWDRSAYYPVSGPSDNLRLPTAANSDGFLGRSDPRFPASASFEVRSSYVLIDAQISVDALLQDKGQILVAEISVDGGRRWEEMSRVEGPYHGTKEFRPLPKIRSEHGSLSAAAGKYQYIIRLTMNGPGSADGIQLKQIQLASRFQLNPRTLPALGAGPNELSYRPGISEVRHAIPLMIEQVTERAHRAAAIRLVTEKGQGILWPEGERTAELVYEVATPDSAELSGFDAGARFLDLRENLAPDKLTAETRTVDFLKGTSSGSAIPAASIAWSPEPTGSYSTVWEYDPSPKSKDGVPVNQVLRWPEIDRQVRSLPAGTRKIYVRYRMKGMGMDSPRLAAIAPGQDKPGSLEVTHQWFSDGHKEEHVERIGDARRGQEYRIEIPAGRRVDNHAIIFYCPPTKPR